MAQDATSSGGLTAAAPDGGRSPDLDYNHHTRPPRVSRMALDSRNNFFRMPIQNNSADTILFAQQNWSRGRQLDHERPSYLATLQDNLFLKRLQLETESEFHRADGSELRDTAIKPAKMRALISSSALAVNFFDAWRGARQPHLGSALGLGGDLDALRFEFQPAGYPVKPRSPNLDLVLKLSTGVSVAVESKFTEPYGTKATGLSAKYFPRSRGLWDAADLAGAQRLADNLRPQWLHLDVPQLLKHMLGLASDGEAPKSLVYLWYDTGLPDAGAHRAEIDRFAAAVAGDRIAFVSRTYQDLFGCLSPEPSPDGWHAYIGGRYFLNSGAV